MGEKAKPVQDNSNERKTYDEEKKRHQSCEEFISLHKIWPMHFEFDISLTS